MLPISSTAMPPHRGDASDLRRVVASAPTRIDFGGGWTDVPPYPERDGGFVCNVAISRRARVMVDLGAVASSDRLGEAALRRARVRGSVRIENDFPVGAGLGGSSAAGVALQAAIARLSGERADANALVARSRAVEVEELGVAGGWQDHYAAAHGGALGLEFGRETVVRRLRLAPECAAALERRCVVVYTGETRFSSSNITAVLAAYEARDKGVLDALARMAVLARTMADALEQGDLDGLGALVREHWIHQRSLHPAITTERIDAIDAAARRAGALGVKALGASGGGCVAIITADDPAPVRDAVAAHGTIMDYTLDLAGAAVESAE